MSNENNKGQKNLKVLFITHNYIRTIGDYAGVFLHLLARKLAEYDIEVHVVAPHDASIPEFEKLQGVSIHRFRYADDDRETLAYRGDMHKALWKPARLILLRNFIRAAYQTACRVIDQERISIVSIHWLVPGGFVGRRLRRKYKNKIRLFLSSHGTDVRLITKYPLVLSFFRSMIGQAEIWTVVSNYLKELITEKEAGLAGKIRVMPLPNDESVFYPDERILQDANLVVNVSRLTVQKKLDVLLEAIKRVSLKRPHIRLEIYGSGPEKAKLERKIVARGLEGRVKILRPVPQRKLRLIYNKASVVVLNSVDEGFGLTLAEAMLCRTAVIGTRSGGITDIIDDRENGLLVPPDDPIALGDEISRLLEDQKLRQRLAESGYRKAVDHFSADSLARAYARLFRSQKNRPSGKI